MGGKNSGRYKRGDKTKSKKIEPILKKVEVKKPEPVIELVEETVDFESNANRILNETQSKIQAEKIEEKKEEVKTENIEPQKPKKEDWSPVVGFVMHVLGGVFETATGFKEMNYSDDEIESCSVAGSEIINVLWPDIKALTEDQKILLLNSMIILKVHVEKVKILTDLKKKKSEESKNEPTEVKTEQTAA